MLRRAPFLLLSLLLTACSVSSSAPLDEGQFRALLDRLAQGWNAGDSRMAADCFREDAVYVEPPKKQVYVGRQALYEFFGGSQGRPGQMSMAWRNVAFDPERQLGFGEFTFSYGGQVHGVAVIRVKDGRIAQWREYWYESELPWEEFVKPGVP
jgi:hypothetical protein